MSPALSAPLAQVLRNRRAHGLDSSVEALAAPLAWLLALRWAEAEDGERAAMAAFNGEDYSPILPGSFSWDRVADDIADGGALADTLWLRVRRALGLPEGRSWAMRSPAGVDQRLLGELLGWVRSLPFETAADRRAVGDAFSEIVVQGIQGSAHAAVLASPVALTRLALALADPKPGERIYDPCCGTGSWLLRAAAAIWEGGRQMSSQQWAQAAAQPLFGVEINPASHLLSFVRLMLAGFKPALELGDALERTAAGRHHEQGFDLVLANPPWGAEVDRALVYDFPIRSQNIEGYFLQHVAQSLRPGGRAVVALPTAFLSRSGPEEEIRTWLARGFRLDAVVNFPARAFPGASNIAISLLAFRRAAPIPQLRILDLYAVPDSEAACRGLAEALRSPSPKLRPHMLYTVEMSRVRVEAHRFAVPAEDSAAAAALSELEGKVPFRKLGDLVKIRRGYKPKASDLFQSGDRLSLPDPTSTEGGGPAPEVPRLLVPYVSVADLLGGQVQLDQRFLRPGVGLSQAIRPNDILLSVSGTIGKLGLGDRLVWMEPPPLWFDGEHTVACADIALLQVESGLDRSYLFALLQSAPLQAAFRARAAFSTIRHLSSRDLGRILLPVPELSVQARVVRHLRARGGGDAVDALASILRGADEDSLTRLLYEHPGVQRLIAGVLDESTEDALVLDVLGSLYALVRERRAELSTAPPEAVRWAKTMRLLAATMVPGLSGGEAKVLAIEIFSVAEMLVGSALEEVGAAESPAGRQAALLSKALIEWIPRSRARTATRYTLAADYRGESSDGCGNGTAEVRISLSGSVGLRSILFSAEPGAGNAIEVGDLAPGESRTIYLELAEEQATHKGEGGVDFDLELVWTGVQWDGIEAHGVIELRIYFCLFDDEVEEVDSEDPDVDIGTSPYKPGAVIDNPALFKGRKDVLDAVTRHLQGGVKVILLEGNRRAGKTSILRRLRTPELGLTTDWLMVECSFQGSSGSSTVSGIPTPEIFRLLIEEIGMACSKAGIRIPLSNMPTDLEIRQFRTRFLDASFEAVANRDPYTVLRSYVDEVVEAIAPRQLLLMLDEFDKIQDGIDSNVTSPQVPENIRHLLQTREGVAAILTGSRRLKRLREEYWSALFGFGYRVPVVALDLEAAVDLITSPVKGRVSYDQAVVQTIIDESARHPYIIQYICAKIFDVLSEHRRARATAEVLEEALQRTVEDYEHLTALWGYAGRRDIGSSAAPVGERRRYLLCVVDRLRHAPDRLSAELLRSSLDAERLIVSPRALRNDLDALVELELLETSDRGSGPEYRIGIPLFARWMRRHQDYGQQLQLALEENLNGGRT